MRVALDSKFFGILETVRNVLEQTCTWKFKYLRYLRISSGRYATYLGEKNMNREENVLIHLKNIGVQD